MKWRCKTASACDFEFLYSNHRNPSARYENCPLDLMICRACGLVALDTDSIDEAWLADYYSKFNPFERPGELPAAHRAMREGQVRWVLDDLSPDHETHTVLDVGCGAGYALKLFRDAGYDIWGIDHSSVMIESIAETYGIPGYVGGFDPKVVERRYDIVTCMGTLEHLLDPSQEIDKFNQALTDDGFLFVEVPDAEFPRWNMVPDHLCFEHLFHFTERTLGRLLELGGFEVVAVDHLEYGPDSGNPECVLRVLARRTANPRTRYLDESDYEHEVEVIREYRRKHDEYLALFDERLRKIAEKVGDEALAIYCGGEHTAALLDRFDLSRFNVPVILDSDPAIAGSEIKGIPVRHSSEAAAKPVHHYLLSTTNHERVIYDQLKAIDPTFRVYGLYQQLD
jgi:SAM-dependent methyltransferase